MNDAAVDKNRFYTGLVEESVGLSKDEIRDLIIGQLKRDKQLLDDVLSDCNAETRAKIGAIINNNAPYIHYTELDKLRNDLEMHQNEIDIIKAKIGEIEGTNKLEQEHIDKLKAYQARYKNLLSSRKEMERTYIEPINIEIHSLYLSFDGYFDNLCSYYDMSEDDIRNMLSKMNLLLEQV